MRVVFVNLHHNEFLLKTLSKFIFKQSVALKHKYLLDTLLADPEVEVCSYVNPSGFSLSSSLPGPLMRLCRALRFAEHRLVLALNRIPRKSVTLLRSPQQIALSDLVIGYRHVPSSLADFHLLPGRKAISLIHFHGEESDSRMIQKAAPHVVFNESDLPAHSEIFRRYYSWYQSPMVVHPFVAAPRFQSITPWEQRECRCFSVGTITYKKHPEFLATYADPCDQPIRKQVLDLKDELEPLIACYNSEYLEGETIKEILPTDSRMARFAKAWHNMRHVGKQRKYFSFDMVEKFNSFKMCLIGEEVLGVPGIGFAEGMACGCAYIGRSGMYEQYGMTEGSHYIGYDGTLGDLKRVIAHWQAPHRQQRLAQIAEAGRLFAETHFRAAPAAKKLIKALSNGRL